MTTPRTDNPGRIRVSSVRYPSFPTDRGMAYISFLTSLIDNRDDTIEIVIRTPHEDQPIHVLVKNASQALAQEFRELARQLDESIGDV